MENKKCLKPPTSSSMCSTTSKETPPKMAPLVPTGSTACNRGTSLRPVEEKAWIKTNLQRTRRLLPQVLLKMTYKKKQCFFRQIQSATCHASDINPGPPSLTTKS